MTPQALLLELHRKGVRLSVVGEDIRVRGPISEKNRKMLKMFKMEVLGELSTLSSGKQWEAYMELLSDIDMRRRGVIPPSWTATTDCQHCGVVPIFEGCAPTVHGCPWCFNRVQGLPAPVIAERSQCAQGC